MVISHLGTIEAGYKGRNSGALESGYENRRRNLGTLESEYDKRQGVFHQGEAEG